MDETRELLCTEIRVGIGLHRIFNFQKAYAVRPSSLNPHILPREFELIRAVLFVSFISFLFTDPRRAHHRRRAPRVIEKVCAQSGTSRPCPPLHFPSLRLASPPSFLPQSPPPRPILIHPGNIRSHNRIASRSRRTARIRWPVLARAHSRDPSLYRLILRLRTITFWTKRTVIPQSLVRARPRPCQTGRVHMRLILI